MSPLGRQMPARVSWAKWSLGRLLAVCCNADAALSVGVDPSPWIPLIADCAFLWHHIYYWYAHNRKLMMKKALMGALLAFALFLGLPISAIAQTGACGSVQSDPAKSCVLPNSSSSYRIDNRIYAGLSWTLGASSNSYIPDFLLGARSLNVNSNNNVYGADINLRVGYKDALSFDSVRVAYVGGTRDLMGNAGLGYSFNKNDIFATAAAQASYSRIGLDYQLGNGEFNPYIEGNSLAKPNSVNDSLSCNGGYSLVNTSTINWINGVAPSATQNGQTCSRPGAG